MLRDVSTSTASMRRAQRWLAEMRDEAKLLGQALDPGTEALFAHVSVCPDCELREHNDPDFCPVADVIVDGPDDEEDGPW